MQVNHKPALQPLANITSLQHYFILNPSFQPVSHEPKLLPRSPLRQLYFRYPNNNFTGNDAPGMHGVSKQPPQPSEKKDAPLRTKIRSTQDRQV
ncbi:hypothetical protein Pmani_000735 [Petrolisthes manimaculis]|uniref:Uncharacterized protein n=1 Tax=Petrolisthes manimaculis TaxID=1843537 RepID=A0AAE1QLW2_9EUCA|nr:hypothetical protein Pmani_000735 [Petrolisthes manimaculis]